MKNIILTMIVLLGFLSGCKKQDDLTEFAPKPDPGQEDILTAGDFLKALEVTGATNVRFDSVSKSYLVSLPDDFNAKKAEVKLTLQPDIFVVDSLNKATPDSIVQYAYAGNPPLGIRLRDKTEKHEFFFEVYFDFTGAPAVELLSKEIPIVSGAVKIPARFTAKIGSIPRAPGVWGGILVKFINKKTGFSTAGEISDFNTMIQFAGASNFVSDDPFTLEVSLYGYGPVVFEGIRFIRGLPAIYIQPSYQFDYGRNDTIRITGGFFLPEKKYTLTFSNDFLTNSVTAPVTVQDSTSLRLDKIPSALAEGSYLVSVHEEDKLVGAVNVYLFGNATRQIETIWQGGLERSVERNIQQLTFNRGEEFYAKPWPVYFGATPTYFDTTRLPVLHLSSGSASIDLEPQPARYSWAIAGVIVGFGKYKIPANLPPGVYTVTGTFPDGTKTKPYWSRLTVQ